MKLLLPAHLPATSSPAPAVRRPLCLLLLLAGMAGCKPAAQPVAMPSPPVAAKVGDAVILVSDVEQEVAWRIQRGAPVPAREKLLEDMVERRLLVLKALSEGLDKSPEIRRSWENLLISHYKEEHVRRETRAVTVSDAEILARYNAQPEKYQQPGKARLAILKLSLPDSSDPAARNEKIAAMQEARRLALEAPPSDAPGFGPLSVKYSEDDVTRHRGGDAGWLVDGVAYTWPAEILAAGFALPAKETSEPLIAGNAIYLVRKLDERPAQKVPVGQVREPLRREIQTEKIRSMEAGFAQRNREGIAIETFPEALATLQIPSPATSSSNADELPPSIP